jgi:D-alanyl-D-alanine carboxypeptidase
MDRRRLALRSPLAGVCVRASSVVLLAAVLLATLPARPARADEPRPPAAGSRAATVIDADSGAVLYARNEHAELAPASLTKMVTALVAVERAPLDRPVRATHSFDVVPVLIGLEPGDTLTLEDALYGLLLNSGNDVALAIAEELGGGSTERFVVWMNELARRLGLQNTRFRNPHGLDQEGHVSTAYDMAVIGRAVMERPELARIVGQARRVVDGPPRWVFFTRNPLLGVYQGVDGIKTGYDDLAGPCLVATAVREGRRAIAVVLNSTRYADDAASLLDYAFEDPRWGPVTPAAPSAAAGRVRLAMLRTDLSAAGDGAPSSVMRAAGLMAPGGERVGS